MGIFALESRRSPPVYLQFRFYLGKILRSVPILGETGNGGLIHMRSYPDNRRAIKAKPG